MNKTVTKIDTSPIIQALGGTLPTNDLHFLNGYMRGTQWYYGHSWDMPIDSQYVKSSVDNWHKRGLFNGQYPDVLLFHVGFVMAMVTLAEQEKNS